MLVDRVKAGVERRRRGDDAEPDQDSAWNSNDAVLRQWERIETQDIFEDEWVIVPQCAIPLVALEDSTMR